MSAFQYLMAREPADMAPKLCANDVFTEPVVIN